MGELPANDYLAVSDPIMAEPAATEMHKVVSIALVFIVLLI
jgi:hypothetical protein